ncbi:2-oxoglutarate dehydrogenase complex dihydrolipoyllysine-residue succinyltransferase [Paenibacillus alkalitolerans]|uniref:2-oxoglutarate dehydrogenase complex dihydrolipoyllysine-residue succinyltransferase n=1 Tax=Paenibacillus alkalitolerans TaxID=2799335 RepID=UPI0018F2D857|nr:2-oxoglutarate dehydrogenase complex dihydrolipoyllysine-residue succinyltransferase [Paenibacillus alkalitolerans]
MIEVKIPELAESITEGTISKWLKSEGDAVKEGDVLFEIETDKVNVEINAEHSGVLKEIFSQPGDTVQVGEVVALLNENADVNNVNGGDISVEESRGRNQEKAVRKDPGDEDSDQPVEEPKERPKAVQAEQDHRARRIATPAARKLAREQGIDWNSIESQDPLGRITADDVKSYKLSVIAPDQKPSHPDADPDKPIERIRMSRRRQTIANHLVQAQQSAAMLTTFNEVDMTAILDLRRRRKNQFQEKHNVRLGFMSFFTKAVISALKVFPMLNAEIQKDEIILKKYYDIGIAVSTDEGLVVPVLRHADRLSFAQIEHEIASLAEKARNNELRLSDLQGGTFTITNGGIFGSLLSTPILNTPQVGILGMHKIQTRPIAIDEHRTENRPMMYIALSYDHRIVDGKEAVSFLVRVKELLEDPENLLLEV